MGVFVIDVDAGLQHINIAFAGNSEEEWVVGTWEDKTGMQSDMGKCGKWH